MSFYRKEQARNVRGFCCPRPLPPLLPFVSILSSEERGEGGPPCVPPRLSSLGSHLSRRPRPETGFLPRLSCQSEATLCSLFSTGRKEGEWSRVTRTMAPCVDRKGRLETTRRHDRGNVGECGKGSRWRKIRRRCRAGWSPVGKVFEKRAEFHHLGVPQGWREQRKSLRSSSVFSVNLEIARSNISFDLGRFDRFSKDSLFYKSISLPRFRWTFLLEKKRFYIHWHPFRMQQR